MDSTFPIWAVVIGGLLLLGMIVGIVVYLLPPVRRESRSVLSPSTAVRRISPAKASPGLLTESFSLTVQTIGDRTTYHVNGVEYQSLDEIPDAQLRARARETLDLLPKPGVPNYTISGELPVNAGDSPPASGLQRLADFLASAKGDISLQVHSPSLTKQVSTNIEVRVGDKTYHSLDEIPDPEIRRQVEQSLQRAPLPAALQSPHDITFHRVGGETRIEVDGKTYRSIEEITDPNLRRIVETHLRETFVKM